jgi:hypothetical protein
VYNYIRPEYHTHLIKSSYLKFEILDGPGEYGQDLGRRISIIAMFDNTARPSMDPHTAWYRVSKTKRERTESATMLAQPWPIPYMSTASAKRLRRGLDTNCENLSNLGNEVSLDRLGHGSVGVQRGTGLGAFDDVFDGGTQLVLDGGGGKSADWGNIQLDDLACCTEGAYSRPWHPESPWLGIQLVRQKGHHLHHELPVCWVRLRTGST